MNKPHSFNSKNSSDKGIGVSPPKNFDLSALMEGFRRKLLKRIKKNVLTAELTYPQMEVLFFIGPKGKKNMDTIAKRLEITPPSATSMIQKMQKKGFVTGKRDEQDRRIVYIELSPDTKKQIQALSKQKESCFRSMIAKLSSTDKENLERIMHILIQD